MPHEYSASDSFIHPAVRLGEDAVQINFPELQDSFFLLAKQFAHAGVAPEDTLWVRLRHDLPHSLLLLFLLDNGFGFVAAKPEAPDQSAIPGVCKWGVSIDEARPEQLIWNIGFKKNPDYSGPADSNAGQYVFFITSGTTGRPKMAAHVKSRLLGNARNCVSRFGLDNTCRIALPVPVWHMFGFGAGLIPGVIAGAAIDIQGDSNIVRFIEREKSFGPDVAYLTPTQIKGITRIRKQSHACKLTIVAGDTLTPEAFNGYEALSGKIVQLYGSTELGAIAASRPEDDTLLRATTVGTPMPGVECRLCPQTHTLLCRHPFGFDGYVGQAGTVERESRTGWFNTHDRAKISDSGALSIYGRNDTRINRDGILIDLVEVARVVQTISCIDSCICTGDGENLRGKRIIAFCTLNTEDRIDPKHIRKQCLDLLARREVPDTVVVLQELPLFDSGKVDVRKLVFDWRLKREKPE